MVTEAAAATATSGSVVVDMAAILPITGPAAQLAVRRAPRLRRARHTRLDMRRGPAPHRCAVPASSGLQWLTEPARDRRERRVDLATEGDHGADDDGGDQGHEQAVLDGGGTAFVPLGLQAAEEHQGHEVQLLDHRVSSSRMSWISSVFRAPTGTRSRDKSFAGDSPRVVPSSARRP